MKSKIEQVFSIFIDQDNKKSIFRLFLAGLIVIFLQVLLFLYKVSTELKVPTVQTKAKVELIKFSQASHKERQKIFNEALDSRIYLWPKEGIVISKNEKELSKKVSKVLTKYFAKEYEELPSSEKEFLLNKTLPTIASDLRKKIRDDFFINKKSFHNPKEILLISHHYTGSSRYIWNGYHKNLLYFLHKDNGVYRLFFSSLSDVADKTNFIESTFLWFFLLIGTNFLVGYLNYYINIKKQIRINKKISNLYKETEQKNNELKALSVKLAKFLDPQIYNSIFTGEKELKVQTYRKMLTVFFVDIKDFTQLTENLDPEPLTNLLNEYINEMSKIANKYGGTVDKFMGDGILIFFGDPKTKGQKQDALNCIHMAIEMREKIKVLQQKWYNEGVPGLLKIRMGIHTGFCTVGNFGSENRLDYTIIGGTVNITSRIESLADLDQILISHSTYALIKDDIECEQKDPFDVKGISYPIKTYQVKRKFSQYEKHQIKTSFKKDSPGFSLSLNVNHVNKKEVEEYLKDIIEKLQ